MFAASRRSVYIGRDEYIARLHAYIAEGGPPLAVVGDSGAGKSALLANWAAAHREANPRDVTIVHFVGASPHSADWEAMLARVVQGARGEMPSQKRSPGTCACLDGRGVALVKLGELADAGKVLEEAAQVVDGSKNPELERHIREILALLQSS